MDDKRLDFEAPFLSVRRFSAAESAVNDSSASGLNSKAARRTSLPFYKPDMNSGPVRHPGTVPFVWENKPGQPKNGLVPDSAGRRGAVVPRPPPGRMLKNKELDAIRSSAKLGSSVRTRKDIFQAASATTKVPDTYEDICNQLIIDMDKEENGNCNVVKSLGIKTAAEEEEHYEDAVKERVKEEDKKKEVHTVQIAQNDCHGEDDDDDDDDDIDVDDIDQEEDAFSDALDTLSRTESFAMNCSVSGISGLPDSSKAIGSFSTDPQVRDFMMGRFLPAAQAMASESPQYTFRRTVNSAKEATRIANRISGGELRREPNFSPLQKSNLDLQYTKDQDVVDDYDGEDEDGQEYDNAGNFPAKGCGLLPKFCLNGNFGRLNPVPGMKFLGRQPLPPSRTGAKIKSSLQASADHPEDSYSWEDVYKSKMVQGYRREFKDGSKSRSESNDLSFSSESPTAEESLSYHRSSGGGTPPYKNEALLAPFRSEKSFLGVPSKESKNSETDGSNICEKDAENFWEVKSQHSSHLDSVSASPSLEKTVYVDSVNVLEGPVSKTSSFSTLIDNRVVLSLSEKDFKSEMANLKTEEGLATEVDSSQLVHQSVVDGSLPSLRSSNHEESEVDNYGKEATGSLLSLLPPPLPRTPSESWLSRTLPSVTSKNLAPQSLMAIGCQPRKQTLQATAIDKKLASNAKIPKPQVRRIRFAEVLASPDSPKSEI